MLFYDNCTLATHRDDQSQKYLKTAKVRKGYNQLNRVKHLRFNSGFLFLLGSVIANQI